MAYSAARLLYSSPPATIAAAQSPFLIRAQASIKAASKDISLAVEAQLYAKHLRNPAIADGGALCTEFVKAVGKGASETIKFSKNLEVSDTIPRPVEQLTQTESPNSETFACETASRDAEINIF